MTDKSMNNEICLLIVLRIYRELRKIWNVLKNPFGNGIAYWNKITALLGKKLKSE